jgi:hypothetical protein
MALSEILGTAATVYDTLEDDQLPCSVGALAAAVSETLGLTQTFATAFVAQLIVRHVADTLAGEPLTLADRKACFMRAATGASASGVSNLGATVTLSALRCTEAIAAGIFHRHRSTLSLARYTSSLHRTIPSFCLQDHVPNRVHLMPDRSCLLLDDISLPAAVDQRLAALFALQPAWKQGPIASLLAPLCFHLAAKNEDTLAGVTLETAAQAAAAVVTSTARLLGTLDGEPLYGRLENPLAGIS